MQSVFDPIFAQILSLVRKQIQAVEDSDKVKMKVSPVVVKLTMRYCSSLGDLALTDIWASS
jgi:hypothetical protein